jgi:hypothetical protein
MINLKFLIMGTLVATTILLFVHSIPKKEENGTLLTINQSRPELVRMSELLRDAMQKIGRLTCEQQPENSDQVSVNGGWCQNFSGRNSSTHKTDLDLAKELSHFLHGKRVASFGDGPGVYKELLLKWNQVKSYQAFDGAPYAPETTEGRVEFLDLSVPVYHLPVYDWVISLEVAEHIPQQFESIFIDNVVRHAQEGVILSWSKEGQPGHSHVNNRNFDYVKARMEEKGCTHDEISSAKLKEKSTFWWFKDNINVYKRIKVF